MQNKRVVITGINGFVGHHLAARLAKGGVRVIGIGQDELVDDAIKDIVDKYYMQDLTIGWPAIDDVDGVIHLAGLANVGASFDQPQRYIDANSAMVTNLGEYYLSKENRPRLLIVSSGAVYDPNQPMPLGEEAKFGFNSPYSISKMLIENQAAYYRNRGLDCIVARPFNHTGPGQGRGFLLPDLFDQLTTTKPGQSVIQVGNINTKRDYTDVRDIVDAYAKIILAPKLNSTVYNVCSGVSLSGRNILHILQTVINKTDIQFKIDPARVRPTDPADIYGDPARICNELGWRPAHSIAVTIRDFAA